MIPYIFVTLDEFKNIFTGKFSLYTYIKALVWYLMLITIVCILYFLHIKVPKTECDNKYYSICFLYPYLLVLLGIYLIFYLLKDIFIKVPTSLPENSSMNEDFVERTCVIIPCHNSEEIIEKTLKSIVKHYYPESIYVADNNNTSTPQNDKTKEICEKYNVNYRYISKSSKINALTELMKEVSNEYEYTITLDDDTLLPENFYIKENHFVLDNKLAGIGFGIKTEATKSILKSCVNMEYTFMFWGKFKSKSTIPYINGAGGLWKSNLLKKALIENPVHNILPYGEDSWNGIILRLNGYKLKQDFQNFVISYIPDKLYYSFTKETDVSGFNATNIYKQRALRWYRSGIAKLLCEFYVFMISDKSNENNNIFLRIIQNIYKRLSLITTPLVIYWIILNLPYLFYYLSKIEINLMLILYIFFSIAIIYFVILIYLIFYKLVIFKNRDDLKFSWNTILVYPFFLLYTLLLIIIAFGGVILYYIPFHVDFKLFRCYKFEEKTFEDIEIEPIEVHIDEVDLVIISDDEEPEIEIIIDN